MKRTLFIFSLIILNQVFVFGQTEIWGTKSFGGKNNGGVLYNVDSETKQINIQHRFVSPKKQNRGAGMVYIDSLDCFIGATDNELFRYDPSTGELKKVLIDVDIHGNLYYTINGKCYAHGYAQAYMDHDYIISIDPLTLENERQSIEISNIHSNIQFTSFSDTIVSFVVGGRIYYMNIYDDSISNKYSLEGIGIANNIGQFLNYNDRYYGLISQLEYGVKSSLCLYSLNLEDEDISTEFQLDFDTTDQGYLANWLAGFVLGNNHKMYGAGKIVSDDEHYYMFSFDPSTSKFDTLSPLPAISDNAILGSFVMANNGQIYSTIRSEESDVSTIFEYNIEMDDIEVFNVFDETANVEPVANLIKGPEENLFGMQSIYKDGMIIRQIVSFNTDTKELVVEKEFSPNPTYKEGFSPGDFIQMDDGRIIGLTADWPKLYQFLPIEEEYKVLIDFEKDFQFSVSDPQIFNYDENRILLFLTFQNISSLAYQQCLIYNIHNNEIEFESSPFDAGLWRRESNNTFIKNHSETNKFERYSLITNELTEVFSYPDSIEYTKMVSIGGFQFLCLKKTTHSSAEVFYDIKILNTQSSEESQLCHLNQFKESDDNINLRMDFKFIRVDSNTLVGDISEHSWGPAYSHRIVQIQLDSSKIKSLLEYSSDLYPEYSFVYDKMKNETYAISARDHSNAVSGYFYQLDFENDTLILLDAIEKANGRYSFGSYTNDTKILKGFEQKQDISYWDGEKDSSWYEPLNWKSNHIPSDTAIVHINDNRPYLPVIDTFVRSKDLLVGAFSKLIINPKGVLTVDRNFINKGTTILYSDGDNKASFICYGKHRQMGYQEYIFSADSSINQILSSPVYQTKRTNSAHTQIMELNSANNTWEEIGLYPFISDVSEAYWYHKSDSIINFVGDLNLSDIQLQSSNTNSGFFPFSNPFLSALDLRKLDVSNIEHQAIYKYDFKTKSYTAFIDGIGEFDMLEPLESFYIYSEGFESFNLGADHRVHKIHFPEDSIPNTGVLDLQLLSDDQIDHTMIRFKHNSSADYEGEFDAFKIIDKESVGPHIFTMASGEKIHINQLADTSMMNLFVNSSVDGEYSIHVNKHDTYSFLVLEDLIWRKRIDLLKQDYSFEYFTSDGDYPFRLYFSQWGLDPVSEEDVQIYYYPESIVVKSRKQIEHAEIVFYDLVGREALTLIAQDFHHYKQAIQLPAGHYIVQLRTGELITNTKILVR